MLENKITNPDKKDNESAYSSVLEIDCNKLVVICGQVAEDENEDIVGNTIEEQTKQVFKNCFENLAKANCTLENVFKVNVYIKNIEDWSRFNDVFKTIFTNKTKPVRTTVQAGLLDGYLIEVELWAAK